MAEVKERLCKCHGAPMRHRKDRRKANGYFVCDIAYRETQKRYSRSEKGRQNTRRVNSKETRKEAKRSFMRLRIGNGHIYFGYARSAEHADILNAHLLEKLNEFKQGQQAGKEAQGDETRAVRPETEV